jgi:large subunit ribosomal protein L7/L12
VTKDELIAAIEEMSVLELAELVKALEDKFGVSAAAPMMAAMPGFAAPAAAGDAPAAEEQTEFDVVLKEIGGKKIQVIKAVRQITSLGLKEAKELVDSAPAEVVKGIGKEEAEEAKAKLEAEGATVELK